MLVEIFIAVRLINLCNVIRKEFFDQNFVSAECGRGGEGEGGAAVGLPLHTAVAADAVTRGYQRGKVLWIFAIASYS